MVIFFFFRCQTFYAAFMGSFSIIILLHELLRNVGFIATVENGFILHCGSWKKNVHNQIMLKQNPAFDQEDKGGKIAEKFKAAGHRKCLQHKTVQLICLYIIQQLNTHTLWVEHINVHAHQPLKRVLICLTCTLPN